MMKSTQIGSTSIQKPSNNKKSRRTNLRDFLDEQNYFFCAFWLCAFIWLIIWFNFFCDGFWPIDIIIDFIISSEIGGFLAKYDFIVKRAKKNPPTSPTTRAKSPTSTSIVVSFTSKNLMISIPQAITIRFDFLIFLSKCLRVWVKLKKILRTCVCFFALFSLE